MISHRCLPWGLYLQRFNPVYLLLHFWKLSEPHRFTRINLDQSNNRGALTT